jgi:prepilin-type processing-associated H-X9-DG protein
VTSETTNQPLAAVAHAGYVAMNGTLDVNYSSGVNDGAFVRNGRLSLARIVDGTSTTLFVGERSTNLSLATWTGAVTGGVVPFRQDDNPNTWDLAPALVLGHSGDLGDVHIPNFGAGSADAFGSHHPAGTNFAFGDGSVRAVGPTVAPQVFIALATRAGGEVVGGNDF